VKTLHVTYSFAPDAVGGTEVYVEALARDLATMGIDSVIAAPGPVDCRYLHDGLRIRRFASDQRTLDIRELYGRGERGAADAFDRILDDEKPDVLHQHALTAACSVQLVEHARLRGLPVVFTYHTPTVSCQRGALLEWGSTVCDGRLDVARCTACSLHGRGLASGISRVLAKSPGLVSGLTEKAGLSGGAWTAVRMRGLTEQRFDALRSLFHGVDRFVALVPWVRALLVANGVQESRIIDSRHGITVSRSAGDARRRAPADPLRVVHLGRVDPVKGTRLLLHALAAIPDAPIELDVFGIVQSHDDSSALAELQSIAASDVRVRFRPPVDHGAVIERLSAYDVVVAPSQTLETGPLVVLEAFAAGVPVIGSALRGIADQVTEGVDGLLVRPHDSPDAWSAALARLCDDRALVDRLRQGIRPVRRSTDVAADMAALYQELTATALV
jgi:glycosyltransferase involved in cell wall biosynthesis